MSRLYGHLRTKVNDVAGTPVLWEGVPLFEATFLRETEHSRRIRAFLATMTLMEHLLRERTMFERGTPDANPWRLPINWPVS